MVKVSCMYLCRTQTEVTDNNHRNPKSCNTGLNLVQDDEA